MNRTDPHRSRIQQPRNLIAPAHKVADDVGVAHDDLVAVLLLFGIGPVDVAAEGGFDASPVLVVLLEGGHTG